MVKRNGDTHMGPMANAYCRVSVAAAFALLAGCANLEWQNPNLPRDRWAADRSACLSESYEVSQRYDQGRYALPGADRELEAMRRYDMDRARRQQSADQQRAFERCMGRKGYALQQLG
jgi:hypothetical protein